MRVAIGIRLGFSSVTDTIVDGLRGLLDVSAWSLWVPSLGGDRCMYMIYAVSETTSQYFMRAA
jgi:hypothetical protein